MAINISKYIRDKIMFKEESINSFRDYYVAFSNDFATNSNFSYSLYAHRLFLYILAKIPSYDGINSNRQEKIEIDFNHFIAVFNLPASGATYKKLHEALEILHKTPVYGRHPFIGEIEMLKKTIYNVSICKDLEKHFFNLRSYVQFPFSSVMGFKSVYSFQIYAALLSKFNMAAYFSKKAGNSIREFKSSLEIDPGKIINMLDLKQPSYSLFKNLNSAVIKKAIKDINDYADLYVEYQGNNLGITFIIRRKTSNELLLSYANLLKKLQPS